MDRKNKLVHNFKNLPIGLDSNHLLQLVSEFKSGNLINKDIFIEAYVRRVIAKANKMARHTQQRDDLASVALQTLCKIPQEVADGRLKDDNIVAYTLGRIKTRCYEFIKKDFLIPNGDHGYKKLGTKPLKQNDLQINEPIDNNIENSLKEIEQLIKKCVVTEGERIVINLRKEGKNDYEIAEFLGCTASKVCRIRDTVEKRFNNLIKVEFEMQTFLPYPDFQHSATCLDNKRLWKQCVETKQLLLGQFSNHPASKMWRGFEVALANYGFIMSEEALKRGISAQSIKAFFVTFLRPDVLMPPWLGNERFHASHRSNLLRKNFEHYKQFGWTEPTNLPYVWPV